MYNNRTLIVHGGAGKWGEKRLKRALKILQYAASKGFEILENDPIQAALTAINILEDSEIFNAGYGASLNLLGEVETDASIMTGDKRSGAVAAVKNVKYTINLARLVMDKTPHILISGLTAEMLAMKHKLIVSSEELISKEKYELWKKAILHILSEIEGREEELEGDELFRYLRSRFNSIISFLSENDEMLTKIKTKLGILDQVSDTVGAVVYYDGFIVAATSTGGTFLKLPGRIGDTPIIGAGTYADLHCGGASSTGIGESIIKTVLAYQAVKYVCDHGIERGLKILFKESWPKPSAGIIVVDKMGKWGVAHNTEHMPVAVISEKEERVDYIWRKF